MTERVEEVIELPVATIDNLDNIFKFFETISLHHEDRSNRIVGLMLDDGYVAKLLELFVALEAENNLIGLHKLFEIMKSIVMLNDSAMFEELFRPEHVMNVMGVFECKPKVRIQL